MLYRPSRSGPSILFVLGAWVMGLALVGFTMKSGQDFHPFAATAYASNAPIPSVSATQESTTQQEAKPPTPPLPAGLPTAAVTGPPVPSISNPLDPGPLSASQVPAAQINAPKIQFATPVYDFGKIKSGEVVKYDFVFTNVGTASLEIKNVQVSCGCTTAGEWSKLISPGQTGSIPIQFHSANLSGSVTKSVTILSNDPLQPMAHLQIKGTIWKAIEVTPQFAVINITAESPSNSVTVRIVNNLEEPLVLSPPTSANPLFAAEIRTNQPGKEYQLIIRTVPGESTATAQGLISVKTSSTNMPMINVTAWAQSQPVITLIPSQISLPSTPIAHPTAFSVSIRNNGTNFLSLSEPLVNAQGVDVQLKELEAGRFYMATVTFPAGFDLSSEERIELAIKSTHPKNPLLKVPIYRSRTVPAIAGVRPAPFIQQTNRLNQPGSQTK